MAKWIWPVMIDMPNDYDFDGASDEARRELSMLDERMRKALIHALSWTIQDSSFNPGMMSVGPVMLPGRVYGWDVSGSYEAEADRLRKELSDGEVPSVREDDAGGRDVSELRI